MKSIWFSSWAKSLFSHTIKGGENFRSGSHEPLPFTVRVWEMPRSLSESLCYYKSVGCHGIFRSLLSRTVSCLQAKRIIQEMNAAFMESRKCCRVKIFISSKSLTLKHRNQHEHPNYSHIFSIFNAVPPKVVWFLFPVLNLWQRTCYSLWQLLGTKDTYLTLKWPSKEYTLKVMPWDSGASFRETLL